MKRGTLLRWLRNAGIGLGALLLIAVVVYSLLPWADLRPAELRGEVDADTAARGRRLLEAAARHHGLESWRSHRTMEVVALDEWSAAGPWWPAKDQRFRARRLLGTFTSAVELLDGPGRGEIWGLQSWRPWVRTDPRAEARRPTREGPFTFYLPALHYFDELIFRLLSADYVLDAGSEPVDGRKFRRVFVTWERPSPHREHDHYLLYLDPQDSRLEMAVYTVREAVAFTPLPWRPLTRAMGIGTIFYSDYRRVEGILVPFSQSVKIGRPGPSRGEGLASWLHRQRVESVAFDSFPVGEILPYDQQPPPADRKPPGSGESR